MTQFTTEELNLITLYDPGNRAGTIYELRDMTRYLMPDENDLLKLTQGVIAKLDRNAGRRHRSPKLPDQGFPLKCSIFPTIPATPAREPEHWQKDGGRAAAMLHFLRPGRFDGEFVKPWGYPA